MFLVSPRQQFSTTVPTFARLEVPPSQIYLVDTSGRYLKQPIILSVEWVDEGYWLATNAEILTHGAGDTVNEAVAEFRSMLVDLFLELTDSEDSLGDNLKRQLEYLRTVLIEESFRE